jgi:hypothetical protein
MGMSIEAKLVIVVIAMYLFATVAVFWRLCDLAQ